MPRMRPTRAKPYVHQDWPAVRYGPNGERKICQGPDDVPKGWSQFQLGSPGALEEKAAKSKPVPKLESAPAPKPAPKKKPPTKKKAAPKPAAKPMDL